MFSYTCNALVSVTGNLALSRALGDFVFKKNDKKRPEEQIVTGLYDIKKLLLECSCINQLRETIKCKALLKSLASYFLPLLCLINPVIHEH